MHPDYIWLIELWLSDSQKYNVTDRRTHLTSEPEVIFDITLEKSTVLNTAKHEHSKHSTIKQKWDNYTHIRTQYSGKQAFLALRTKNHIRGSPPHHEFKFMCGQMVTSKTSFLDKRDWVIDWVINWPIDWILSMAQSEIEHRFLMKLATFCGQSKGTTWQTDWQTDIHLRTKWTLSHA